MKKRNEKKGVGLLDVTTQWASGGQIYICINSQVLKTFIKC